MVGGGIRPHAGGAHVGKEISRREKVEGGFVAGPSVEDDVVGVDGGRVGR